MRDEFWDTVCRTRFIGRDLGYISTVFFFMLLLIVLFYDLPPETRAITIVTMTIAFLNAALVGAVEVICRRREERQRVV